ncbi:ssrA-binding protein [Malacoplasma iowae]|uniref:SsrA-binding protein n=2 Tax=Malacoplasma iowae TaxID=2116 RepID=A0A6P1LH35_MALIO|nr:SsrA-binding protein [Malacoplasma iowae 695]QHG89405.1 SsrA-binding protein SmpB [Malacoplasma iowae 695]VEU62824.1 ssrA-binding protein [Mycoplasmopsis fermentans]VEU71581.1 ssrA-binding protein [Malacoplasma iowae]
MKILVVNKKANFNYTISDTYEAGIELKGVEVKSLQSKNASINESYITFIKNEAFIINMHIAPYENGNIFNVDQDRRRKLLLHKHEIIKLQLQIKKDSITLVPLKVYWKRNKIKVLIGLAKGKNVVDKRNTIKERDAKRESKKYF